MERMKIEIEKSEYDRLKSREEKLMAYYEWFVDKENDLVTVEDVVNKNIELEEENKNLKSDLDKYKHYYDRDKEELMESCYGLSKENKKLKSDLSECECSFGFESDEVGFWKREYKRLKKWIKDHCNGYGNLFPEDEMKRQWKKADKKRKLKSTYVYDAKQVRDIC